MIARGFARGGNLDHWRAFTHVLRAFDDYEVSFFDARRHFENAGLTAARSQHTGGVMVLLCDGSSRFVNDSIDAQLWQSLATRAGGEVLGEF